MIIKIINNTFVHGYPNNRPPRHNGRRDDDD